MNSKSIMYKSLRDLPNKKDTHMVVVTYWKDQPICTKTQTQFLRTTKGIQSEPDALGK